MVESRGTDTGKFQSASAGSWRPGGARQDVLLHKHQDFFFRIHTHTRIHTHIRFFTAEVIAEGTLRIGKEIDNPHCAGKTFVVWHNMEPPFASFHKGKADKARITDVAQLKGFNELKQQDKDRITELVAEKQAMAAELAAADSAATRLEHTKDGGVFWQISVTGSKTRTRWGPM